MDRDLDVRTPESIAFTYELAGLGSRFLAITLDLIIQIALLLLLVYGFSLLPQAAPVKSSPAEQRFFENAAIALLIFVIFVIFFGYFIIFEAVWNGQTPGKKMLGIRVVRDGGYPIDFSASLVRNLIRVGEWLVGFYGISAICALLSHENKRVGDLAAGTIVVRDARAMKSTDLFDALRKESNQAAAVTSVLDAGEREVVNRFLERRDSLMLAQRRTLAAQLAARFRPRIGAELGRLDDEALLERL